MPFRRFQSAPGEFRREDSALAILGDLLPHTEAVRQQLVEGGPATTVLDISLGIAERLLDVPAVNEEEARFLAQCLKVGHAKTSVPCGVLMREDFCGIENFMPRTDKTVESAPFSMDLSPRDRTAWPMEIPNLPVQGELRELLEARFDFWGFDTFTCSRLSGGRPLQLAGWEALRRSPCVVELELEAQKVQGFLQQAESHYASMDAVSYHNNLHAADVTQSVHALLSDVGFINYFDAWSGLALVLSAIIHDMGHDGRSNTFHVNVQDQLALTYNDQSVLENFHVSQAFKLLLNDPETNPLEGFPKDMLARTRKEMIDNVLGTDMAHHFRTVSTFKTFCEKHASDPYEWCSDSAAMTSLGVMLLHTADISNPAKPKALSDRWTDLLKQEFYKQGDEEKRLGLPISPLCDRSAASFASSQVGFIKFVVQPAFSLLMGQTQPEQAAILPEIAQNLELWEDRASQEERSSCSLMKACTAPSLRAPEEREPTMPRRHGGA